MLDYDPDTTDSYAASAETPSAPGDTHVIPDARMDAFIAISGERDYQDATYPQDIYVVNVGDTLLLIEEFLNRAKEARVFDDGPAVAHNMRKVAAIAVRAMEVLGTGTREQEDAGHCGE